MGADRDSLAAEAFDDSNCPAAVSGDVLPGSLASLDSTLPPTPLRDLLAADGATIFVLTADLNLTSAVEQAAGDEFPTRVVLNWSALVDAAASRRTHIVLVDADALSVPLAEAIAQLQDAAPSLVVLVAARREAAHAPMSLLSERKVHRLLIKPAAEGITRLLLESAVGRYLQIRDRHDGRVVVVDEIRPSSRYRRPPSSRSPWLLASALGAAAVGAVIVGELYGVRWPPLIDRMIGTSATVEADAGISIGEEPEGVLTNAGFDIGEGSDELVRARSAGAPSSPGARSERDDTPSDGAASGSVVAAHVQSPSFADSALPVEAPDPETVARAANRPVGVQHSSDNAAEEPQSLGTLRSDPAAARPAAGAQSLLGASEREAELDTVFNLIDAHLADGRLLAPADDSAMTYFERAVQLRPNDPRVLARRTAIAAGLVEAAHAALERGGLDEAQRLAQEAFRLGAEREGLALLDGELVAARRAQTAERQSEQLSAATALIRDGRLLAGGADGQGALGILAALRRERASVPGLAVTWDDLVTAVATRVRAAIDAGDFDIAKTSAAALAIDGGDPELAAELEFEARQAEYLATPVPSSVVDLLETPPLIYPEDAQRSGIEGWVDLEFIVDGDGRTRDVAVVESLPRGWFDEAAIETVALQRYVPFTLDGRTYQRRVRLRIRFDLR